VGPVEEIESKKFATLPDFGKIYIFREIQLVGSMVLHKVTLDENSMGMFGPGGFLVAKVQSGEHEVLIESGGITPHIPELFKVTVNPGQIVFVKHWLDPNGTGEDVLRSEMVDEEQGKEILSANNYNQVKWLKTKGFQSVSPTSPKEVAFAFPSKPVNVQFRTSIVSPNDIAIIIGNADYKKQGKDIPNVTPAYADAEGMRLYAKQALGIVESNIIFLKDATQKDLVSTFGSESNYKGRLFRYLTEVKSRVFVYYSGHGAPGDGDVNYLVPTNAESSLIDLNGYSLKTLYQNLSKLPAKSVTVVLEACFSGASEAGTVINNASPIYLKAQDTSIPSNITVIAAGAANQIASWEEDKSHSLFTKYFLMGMSGEADNDNDRKVSLDELRDYLAKTVTRSAMRYYGREQTPQIVVGSGG